MTSAEEVSVSCSFFCGAAGCEWVLGALVWRPHSRQTLGEGLWWVLSPPLYISLLASPWRLLIALIVTSLTELKKQPSWG